MNMDSLEIRPANDGGFAVLTTGGMGMIGQFLFAGELSACLDYIRSRYAPEHVSADEKWPTQLAHDVYGLSVRTLNCLIGRNIRTVDDLTKWTAGDLLSIENFGRKSLNELIDVVLRPQGLRLASSAEAPETVSGIQ